MDDELKQQFDDQLGVELSPDVLAKAFELCTNYNITDAVEFVEQWTAFSLSHLNGAEPTVEHLCDFERKVYQTKRDKSATIAANKKKERYTPALSNLSHLNTISDNPLAIYGIEQDPMDDYMSDVGKLQNNEVIENYAVHTPKAAKSAFARTPARHTDVLFSPVSYTPNIGTPRSHSVAATAGGSGKIIFTSGNPTLIKAAQWTSQHQRKIHVKQLLRHNGEALSATNSNARYMFDNLHEKCEIMADRVFNIGKALCRKVFGEEAIDYELSHVDVPVQDTTKTIGIIDCEHDGPLDIASTLLVGSDEMRCRTVALNFSRANSYAVFQGQVVMVTGMNPRGDEFFVGEVLSERDLQPPAPPTNNEQLSFVIAAGPFTHSDDLLYEPLQDLITYLKENKPDVLILMGPFQDAEHKMISEDLVLAESFESFFEKMITGIMDAIGSATTILLISSHRDVNSDPVYPTMPITVRKTYPNLHLLPDPSIIDLNGIVIGVTTTDIVDHIANNELANNAGEKIKRIVHYLFQQGSFYPLMPPPEDANVCLDSNLANKFAIIERIPNILILPSNQKSFGRVSDGCLAINPGRLADVKGGTFARLIVAPNTDNENYSILKHVACQIKKI